MHNFRTISRARQLLAGRNLRASLVRAALGSAGILAVSRILVLAVAVVLARLLGATGYGIYAYAFAIMSLLTVPAEAGIPTLLMREVAASDGRGELGMLRGAVIRGLQFVLTAATLVSGLGLIALWLVAGRLDDVQISTNLIMLLILPLAAVGKTITYVLRGLRQILLGLSVELLLRPSIVLALGLGLLIAPEALHQPQYAMASQLAAVTIVAIVAAVSLQRATHRIHLNAPPQYRTLHWLKNALPFTLIGSAGIINNQADLIMIGWYRPPEDVGIYRVAVQGASLIPFGLQAIGASVAPQIARLYGSSDLARLQRLLTRSAQAITLTALPLTVVLVIFGDNIIGWLFGQDFIDAYAALSILAIGQLVNAAMGTIGILLNMSGHERQVAKTLWATAILNILLNIIMIPFFGTIGAAAASTISLVTWNLTLHRIATTHLGLNASIFPSRAK